MHNIEIVVGPLGCILLIFLFGVYQSKSIVMEFQFNSHFDCIVETSGSVAGPISQR
ncbi:hypothetical protein HID58_004221 [Brassica napus]|uniref:Uncharacterized protein n=1 Tax=Brassica napus TaxID=3708 RepID=A0ABQ8E7X2_BRANA|nr:hypothetical protein HID58_004221 [Brassica napus]